MHASTREWRAQRRPEMSRRARDHYRTVLRRRLAGPCAAQSTRRESPGRTRARGSNSTGRGVKARPRPRRSGPQVRLHVGQPPRGWRGRPPQGREVGHPRVPRRGTPKVSVVLMGSGDSRLSEGVSPRWPLLHRDRVAVNGEGRRPWPSTASAADCGHAQTAVASVSCCASSASPSTPGPAVRRHRADPGLHRSAVGAGLLAREAGAATRWGPRSSGRWVSARCAGGKLPALAGGEVARRPRSPRSRSRAPASFVALCVRSFVNARRGEDLRRFR
jgi:hypothetical protein